MDLRAQQAAIKDQLNVAFAGTVFTAQELPEVDADYQRAVPNPIAYVVYTGSSTIGHLSTDPVVQERKLKFNIECYGRLLYGPNGIFALRAIIETALIGFAPPNSKRLYLVSDEISRGEDSIWSHVYAFECITTIVQANLEDPIIVPSLKSIGSPSADFTTDYNTDYGEGKGINN